MNSQYNVPVDLRDTKPSAIVEYLNRQFTLIGRALRGAVVFDAGQSGLAITINPTIADVTALELTDNAVVTLKITDLKRGMNGTVEFLQDATGGRIPSWVNLVGTAPAIAAGIGKRTLVLFTNVGDGSWVATILATNY